MQIGSLTRREEKDVLRLSAAGAWDIGNAARLDQALGAQVLPAGQPVLLDLSGIEAMDTVGAWLVHRSVREWRAAGATIELAGLDGARRSLLDEVASTDHPVSTVFIKPSMIVAKLARLGGATVEIFVKARGFLGFLGLVMVVLGRSLVHPRRIRVTALVHHMERAGFDALPVVGLISFLIGVVLAYQGASELSQFGADIFVVNLLAISVLRELGILLAAIVIAGRSGSAFTAQIGSMKLHEEVDAMRALGLDPVEMLVLPRLLALVATLPLLCFFADLMGLLGGAVMAWSTLGIPPVVFIQRLSETVGVEQFFVGLIKAPFFAAVIALVGCYEGFAVSGSAESLGERTTRAVVEAIFLVIVIDAAFSVFFNLVNL